MSLRGLLLKGGRSSSTHSLNALAEPQNLEDAMRAANHILNDDLESAEAGLKDGNSTFHKLGRGLVSFMKASLSFEADAMKEAAERLAEAESAAASDSRRAQRENSGFHSKIYGAGSEYALCGAEAQLLSAIVGLLNESLSESLKGFYKLRKAYITLQTMVDAEDRYMQSHHMDDEASPQLHETNLSKPSPATNNSFTEPSGNIANAFITNRSNTSTSSIIQDRPVSQRAEDWDSDEESFVEARESIDDSVVPHEYTGFLEVDGHITHIEAHSVSLPSSPQHQPSRSSSFLEAAPVTPKLGRTLTFNPDSDVFDHSIDVFVHSGASVFFGLIQLLLSMIPPAFARLLSIIGFQGDRARGLALLWQATKFHNVYGALAGLVLLNYYNSFVGFNDIFPDQTTSSSDLSTGESIQSHPIRRLESLLREMRTRYPQSGLWLLEDARMHASKRDLDTSLSLIAGALANKDASTELKQVRALQQFEFSLQTMYSHQYTSCTASFEECCKLNNWSHALYYYIAACAQYQLYRESKTRGDTDSARTLAAATEELLQKSRSQSGKRRFMARQLPFDAFITRKISRWDGRATASGTSMVEGIGVSPLVEIIYFWNGFKKMAPKHVRLTLDALDDSEKHLHEMNCQDVDEIAALAVLKAASLRTEGRYTEAAELLKNDVVPVASQLTKGGFKDNWAPPTAYYELAANNWSLKNEHSRSREEMTRLVREAQEWLEKASRWESYELEARMGMRITTGLNTVKAWLREHAEQD